jgi:putative Mg2+ transporter-C (MgtC) family protein
METLWQELTHGLDDRQHLLRVLIRLLAAMILGGVIGIQRERSGKAAGFRTHMMVCLGTAVFVIACSGVGMQFDAVSRVIQGLVTGIGFIGAGTILKLEGEEEIKGLTTAAGIWMTAAIGITIGLGAIGVALMGTVLALVILAIAQPFEDFFRKRRGLARKSKER